MAAGGGKKAGNGGSRQTCDGRLKPRQQRPEVRLRGLLVGLAVAGEPRRYRKALGRAHLNEP